MRYEAEIVVCGAGTAGSVAAIAAADAGRDVLVIEQFGSAGGSSTLALVTPLMNTCVPGNPMGSYVSREINPPHARARRGRRERATAGSTRRCSKSCSTKCLWSAA